MEPQEPESRHTEQLARDAAPPSNVVRFPRDWIGPREELVPLVLPGRAEDFWGEGLGAAPDGPEERAIGDAGIPAIGEPAADTTAGARAARSAGPMRRARAIGTIPAVRFSVRAADLSSQRVLAAIGIAVVAIACSALAIDKLGARSSVHPLTSAASDRSLGRAEVTLPQAAASHPRAADQIRHRATTSRGAQRGAKPVRRHRSAPTIVNTPSPHVVTAVVVHRSLPAPAPASYTPPPAAPVSRPVSSPPTYTPPPAAPAPRATPRAAPPTTTAKPRAFGQGGMLGPGHGNGTG